MTLDSAVRKFGWLRSAIFFSLAFGWIASAGPAQSECRGVYSKMCTPETGSGGGGTSYDPPVYYPSPEEIARNQATEFNNQGVEAYNRGDLHEAIRLYELAVRTSPSAMNQHNLGVAYNDLGAELSYKGDWEGALYWYQLGRQYYSDQVNTDNIAKAQAAIEMMAREAELNKQGINAHNKGDYREAIRLYELALQAGLNDANASTIRNNLGLAYNNLGAERSHQSDWGEALRLYLLAQQNSSDPVIIDNIAKAQAQIERIAKQAEEQRAAEIAAREAARKEAQRQTVLATAQQRTEELLANLRDNLPRQTWDGDSTSTSASLVFMDGSDANSAADGNDPCSPSKDASVVDLCFPETKTVLKDPNSGHFKSDAELGPGDEKAIGSMIAMVKKEGWTEREQDRLNLALRNLPLNSTLDGDQVQQVWNDMEARGPGSAPAQDAVTGEGPVLYRPGQRQQSHDDCALYALASAANLPYGVVAARAGELLRQAEWRSSAENNNSQQVYDGKPRKPGGLNVGEIAILAEAFGQAEIIPPSDFSKTLKEGRPVIIGVGLEGGGGHEVVLSKTFEHKGKTWYEMMDSNQEDPLRRRYLSAAELDGILLDNGLAFRPEPGRTPKLLK